MSRWSATRLRSEVGSPARDPGPRGRPGAGARQPLPPRASGRARPARRGTTRRPRPSPRGWRSWSPRTRASRRRSTDAKAASRAATATRRSLKYEIVENLLRVTPRFQQARHDVDPGVVGLPLEDWGPEAAAAVAALVPAPPIPVRFAEVPGPCSASGAPRWLASAARTAGRSCSAGRRDSRPPDSPRTAGASRPRCRAPRRRISRRRRDQLRLARLRDTRRAVGGDRDRRRGRSISRRAERAVVPLDFDSDGDLDLYVSVALRRPPAAQQPRRLVDGRHRRVGRAAGDVVGGRGGSRLRPRRRHGSLAAAAGRRNAASRQPRGAAASGRARRASRRQRRRSARPRPAISTATAGSTSSYPGDAGTFAALNRGDGTFLRPRASGPGRNSAALRLRQRRRSWTCSWPQPSGASVALPRRTVREGSAALGTGALPPAVQAEAVDVDGDGDLDLVLVTPAGGAALFENRGGNANAWIDVALEGLPTGSAKVNRLGFGSEVEAKAQELYVYRVVSRPVTRLGLGARRKADVLRVVWTNGIPQNTLSPPVKTVVREVQQLKGSCPFLYAFDGGRERWSFVTDVLGTGARRASLRRSPPGAGRHAGVARRGRATRLTPSRGAARRSISRRSSGRRRTSIWPSSARSTIRPASRWSPDEKMVPAALSGEAALHVDASASRRARSTAAAATARREIANEDGVFLAGFSPDALPGHRGAARARPGAAGGARRPPGHAVSDGLDSLRRHVDQRLALAASRPRRRGARARGAGRAGEAGGPRSPRWAIPPARPRRCRWTSPRCSTARIRACASERTSRSPGTASPTRWTIRRRRCARRRWRWLRRSSSSGASPAWSARAPTARRSSSTTTSRRSRAGPTWPGATRASATCASS